LNSEGRFIVLHWKASLVQMCYHVDIIDNKNEQVEAKENKAVLIAATKP
jgi:hypothetical protein